MPPRPPRTALIQVLLLIALCLFAHRDDVLRMLRSAMASPEAAHFLATPVLIAVLAVLRRDALREALGRGSIWGIVVLGLSLLLFLLSSWPFDYRYARYMTLPLSLLGVILAVGGGRLAWRCLPMIFLLVITIPVGALFFVFLLVKPAMTTMEIVGAMLDVLPGVTTELRVQDMYFMRGGVGGAIALGEPDRGASLILASLAIAIFVTFARIRPWWQVLAMAIAAGPIVLFANGLRLLTHSVATIYGNADPLAATPRMLAALVSLLTAYGLSVLVAALLGAMTRGDQGVPDREQ